MKASFEAFPLVIGWELTLKCNLRCRHCGSSAGTPRISELTTKEAHEICDQFPELLVQEVDFTGGEPLLREDWIEIVRHLKQLRINVNLLTHGLNLGYEKIAQIKKSGVSCLGISLDGLEQSHDYVRGCPGAFKRVVNSIRETLKANMPLQVITTVNSLNFNELPDILHLLHSLGVESWRPQPLIPIGRVKESKELLVQEQVVFKLGQFIRQWAPLMKKEGMDIICCDGLQYIFNGEDLNPNKPWRGCPAGWVACGITSDGKIKGCLSMQDDLVEGDLRKHDLWDIWFHPDSFSYNRRFSPAQLGPNCVSCDKGEKCKGGCSINSYAATGIFHNDPFCFYRIDKLNSFS